MRILCLALLAFTISTAANAKSAKKAAADQITFEPPQVLEVNDNIFGLRAGQGSAFDGNSVIGFNYERIVHPNLGITGQLHYASYKSSFAAGGFTGEWEYTAWTLLIMGSLHSDIFHTKNLDAFVSGGVGHSFLTSTWKSNAGFNSPGSADSSKTFLAAYATVRYFLNSKWGLSGSLGTGVGTIQLGADYLF